MVKAANILLGITLIVWAISLTGLLAVSNAFLAVLAVVTGILFIIISTWYRGA